jgi:hypothetical protein
MELGAPLHRLSVRLATEPSKTSRFRLAVAFGSHRSDSVGGSRVSARGCEHRKNRRSGSAVPARGERPLRAGHAQCWAAASGWK